MALTIFRSFLGCLVASIASTTLNYGLTPNRQCQVSNAVMTAKTVVKDTEGTLWTALVDHALAASKGS